MYTLQDACSIISRGWNIQNSLITDNIRIGECCFLLSFGNIKDNECEKPRKICLKSEKVMNKNGFYYQDILLPAKIGTNLNIRSSIEIFENFNGNDEIKKAFDNYINANSEERKEHRQHVFSGRNIIENSRKLSLFLMQTIYTSSIVFLRVKDSNFYENVYTYDELTTLLNTDIIKRKLIEEVYSKNGTIMIERLKEFNIPAPTNEIKQMIKTTQKSEEIIAREKIKKQNAQQILNNYY